MKVYNSEHGHKKKKEKKSLGNAGLKDFKNYLIKRKKVKQKIGKQMHKKIKNQSNKKQNFKSM